MTEGRTTYRHGDLPRALVAAGVELAREGGPEAVVLRAATRLVGVSPNAAYRHFADHRALLREVCAVAMGQLAVAMETRQQAIGVDPPGPGTARSRLRAVGAGYLDYARTEPGLFRTAFAVADELGDLTATTGGRPVGAGATGRTPYELLGDALDGLVTAGLLPVARRPDAEVLAWSAVHGLALLLIDGPLRGVEPAHADTLTAQLLDHVEAGLLHPVEPRTHPEPTRTPSEPTPRGMP